MEDFDIPTRENRLLLHRGVITQVMLDFDRNHKPSQASIRNKKVQRELKQIICFMLKECEQNEDIPDPIVGNKVRVTMQRIDGVPLSAAFEFRKKGKLLKMREYVCMFRVTVL